ncbi:MAG: AraC family transcriptional regulator, partial [Chitinophagaceae bacterium]|nr:AraC family transcriptional regulator [Chitinophagaceae bacterium]
MFNPPDILALAYKQPVMQDQLVPVQEREQNMPGSVVYSIKRYQRNPQWNIEDTGMMVYHFKNNAPKQNFLELKFCITGNAYCTQKENQCGNCKNNLIKNCLNKFETIDVLSFRFSDVH